MKLEICGAFPTLNEYIQVERGNRFASAKMKKTYTDMVVYQTIGKKWEGGLADVIIEWRTSRRADHDNVAFAKKFILDGLVKARVIGNDNPKHIRNFTDKFTKVAKGNDGCIVHLIKVEG